MTAKPQENRRDAIITEAYRREGVEIVLLLTRSIERLSIASKNYDNCELRLRYVPHRYVLAPDGLDRYVDAIRTDTWINPESFALAVLDDLNNELVPRWLGIHAKFGDHQAVVLEDQQPRWSNPDLLNRLPQW